MINIIYKFSYCECCGKLIKSEYREKRFCSKECRYKTVKVPKEKVRETYNLICKHCDQIFTTKNPNQIFCNNEHKKEYYELHLKEKQCYTCGNIFKPKRIEQDFCSIKCSKPRKNEYFKKLCKICGKVFDARYEDTNICTKCRVNFKTNKCSKWHGKWCQYKDIKIMSTYELRVCNILDKMKDNKLIYDWSYTKDKIKYIGIDNKQHNYIIDFKVFVSENEFKFLEVKGVQRPNDILKWKATRDNGFNLDIWFLSDIENKEIKLNINKEEITYLLKMCVINKEES